MAIVSLAITNAGLVQPVAELAARVHRVATSAAVRQAAGQLGTAAAGLRDAVNDAWHSE